MPSSNILKTAALLSASLAALSLGACNPNGGSQNGAYVATAADSAAPASSPTQGSLPPSNEYQAVANTAPPPLPVYDQPPAPDPGYVWTPGYWDWSDDDSDYYWVPGTWVEPPSPGLYWTPGYWRYYNGRYLFSRGYWGPQVGFYGGVDYGYGYAGNGYVGGRWQGNQFYYNTQVNNLGGRRFDRTYSQSAPAGGNRASYNGGPGGLRMAPTQAEVDAAHGRHFQPTAGQMEQARTARTEPGLRASVNRGSPAIAATARPNAFHAAGAVTAARSAGAYTPPARAAGPANSSGENPRREGPPSEGARPGRPAPAAPVEHAPREAEAAREAPIEHAPGQTVRPLQQSHMAPERRAPPARATEPRTAPRATEPRAVEPRPAETRPAESRPAAPRPAPARPEPRAAPARPAEHAPAHPAPEERRGPEPH
jgi:hypothetical protein